MTLDLNKTVKEAALGVVMLIALAPYAQASYPSTDIKNEAQSDSTFLTKLVRDFDVDKNQLERLSIHPQWQHLLFYKNGKAEVISDGFYLSDPQAQLGQAFSPYNELVLTLNQIENQKVVCQFPARYLWLSHHIDSIEVDFSSCSLLPNPEQNISLVLVSNYLKNPASSFGHVLVKTNKHDSSASTDKVIKHGSWLSSEDLLNNTYNFGARIPQNENGAIYAIKGLFGKYSAGFAEAEFFKQDAVYSKNEQRDMWEYVLNLKPFETQLLNYHLFESKSARFDYYFIKQNCGYRSGEILELISDVKTTDRIGPWYAPDYIFDQLVEHDRTAQTPIIATVRYLPSEQTQLRQKFVQLSKSLQDKINYIIQSQSIGSLNHNIDNVEVLQVIDTLSDADQALVLDFLILHQTYKITQERTSVNQAFKKQLISKRLMLSENNTLAQMSIPIKPSPALSNKTTKTQLTLSEGSAELGLSLFVKDPLNDYTDINKRFEAVNTTVRYDFEDEEFTLKEFVFLDMQQIEDLTQPLANEPKLSWQLSTGSRTDPFNNNHHRPYAQGGLGAGAIIGDSAVGYTMLNIVVHDQKDKLDMGLEIGMRAKRGNQAAEISYNQTARHRSKPVTTTTIIFRQQLSKNNDARLFVSRVHNDNLPRTNEIKTGLVWHHYW